MLNEVTVTWDEQDIGQAPLGGNITFQLSAVEADSADGIEIHPTPAKTYFFIDGTGSSDPLVANDNVNLAPSGSYYTVTVAIKGQPSYTFTTLINFANGASQTLAYLYANQAVPAAQYSQYLPLPSGTATAGYVPVATGAGEASAWAPNGSGGGGSGTVTTVSVATANGFAGTVANPTTTPAITVKTGVTGLLKGNGTAVSAATAGTDYVTPTGSGATLTGITAAQVGADASGAAAGVQTNLTAEVSRAEAAEALLAPKASPTFTGTPAAPTASALTDTTQLATTAYADSAVAVETSRAETAEALKAPLASPALTGSPTAPTQTTGDSTTKIATDAFVATAVATETTRAEAAEALLVPLSDLPLSIAHGGSGQITQQLALNALAGAVTTAEFLRGNGTNVGMAAIQAADVPTLNQSTTGNAATATTAAACSGNAATATNLAGGATLPDYLAPAAPALSFVGSGTTLVNAAAGNAFNLTLTASTTTLGNPSNPVDGQVIRFRVTQGSGGSFTLAYGTAYDFGAGSAPTLSTSAGKVDIVAFEYVASISKWCCLNTGGLGY